MTESKPKPNVEVINPRYAGVTPEMVARALLRPVQERRQEPEMSNE